MTSPADPSRPPAKSLAAGDKAISLVGPSGSGKTELICRLLPWFEAQGLKVAVLKHTHKVDLGDKGKDTWRFAQAGARLVALAGPGLLQITQYAPEDPPLATVLAALAPQADLILVEGYKKSPLPKVAVVGPELENLLTDHSQVIALVSSEPVTSHLPVFHPHQTAELGAFIKKYLGYE
ncbi:MAG: molybdopterin-guanine dinucleotide biosynthesis protein B [Desulfobaccales bacterium]|nr:molybdopterin-guanine dinucleotide biosynthesis protein B [Desulfobaccales bacterium]